MSYDSKLKGILARAAAICSGNASKGLKEVKNAEQIKESNSNRLPRDMSPSQADFEKLGFTFTDINDSVLFEATLPEGWSIQRTPGSCILWNDLLDDKGRVRGKYYYKSASYDRSGHMILFCRYNSTFLHTDPFNYYSSIDVVVIDADNSVIFNAGRCEQLYSEDYYKLISKAEEYLKSNYPEWRDVTKYWD